MLIRFRIANFRSLRDEQELSMVAAAQEGRSELVHVDELDVDVVPVAAIYGANAAGKSNVLAALELMREAIVKSHRGWSPDGPLPNEPFLLDAASRAEPSTFEVDFLLAGVRFQYGFKLGPEQVLEEWLYAYPKRRRQVWFIRDARAGEPFTFGKQLKGNNRVLRILTRKNSLFLSVAAENNHEALSPVYAWFAQKLFFTSSQTRRERVAHLIDELRSNGGRGRIVELLRLADLGIHDVAIRREPVAHGMWLFEDFELVHGTKGKAIPLPFDRESRGTQAWLSLAGTILHVLERGAVLCVDELDASLHPRLALEVIRIFQDPERNPRHAQLIFNTHDTTLLGNLLGGPSLHRDQVWFIEKDQEGASHLYPLTDFKPRKLENLERGYLQGRYGAIPFISSQLLTRDA